MDVLKSCYRFYFAPLLSKILPLYVVFSYSFSGICEMPELLARMNRCDKSGYPELAFYLFGYSLGAGAIPGLGFHQHWR